MIEIDDIKECLEFILPYSNFKDEEDEKEYIRCLVQHGFDGVRHWSCMFYTKIQFDGEECTLKTAKRPVFEVLKFEADSVFVKNKNAIMTDDMFMFIDISFVEKFGEKFVKKQKRKRRNDKMTAWEVIPIDKYSIHIVDNIPHNKFKKNADGEICFNAEIELSAETCKKLNEFKENLAKIAKELAEEDSKKEDVDRFKEITDKMLETFKAKNHDYGSSFSNLFKECGMTYAYGHMAEKLERINSLRKNEAKVKGESMKDSLYDLANYAILTIMELDKTEK